MIVVLVLAVIILTMIVIYAFVIKPAINGYTIRAQTEGYNYAIVSLIQEAQSCKPIPLTFNNQTVNIIAVNCLQQQLS